MRFPIFLRDCASTIVNAPYIAIAARKPQYGAFISDASKQVMPVKSKIVLLLTGDFTLTIQIISFLYAIRFKWKLI